jgi:hypothetical protein
VPIAAQFGFERGGDEIAEFLVLAGHHRRKLRIERIEMIHQAFAAMAIDLQPFVEIRLLKDDAIMNAGDFAIRGRFTAADLLVICLFAAGQRGEQIVADRTHVELVNVPAVRRRDERHEAIAGQANFRPAVEVVVLASELDPGLVLGSQAAALSGVEQVVGRD